MRLLLTRPFNRTSMLIPNHGLGYLATALKQNGYDAVILDCIRDGVSADALAEHITESSYDIIGFQVYTFDLEVLRDYLSRVAQHDLIIVAGGPHPSADPTGMLRVFPQLDYVFQGEAEISLPALTRLLESTPNPTQEQLSSIPGLCWRQENSIICNPPVLIDDLDSLGFPDWEQIAPTSYPVAPQGTFVKHLPLAPVIITRGCPFPCTFCAGKQVSGHRVRTRSVPHVISELQYLTDKYGIREFHIQDDNFTYHRSYIQEFCQSLMDSGLKLSWACPNGLRLDTLDREILQIMEAAGCYSVAVGIESGSQRILDKMKKNTSLERIIHQIQLIKSTTRWSVTGFFILGYPGETQREMEATIRLSRRLPLDKANFGILMPLPGTEAAREAEACGFNPRTDYHRMSEYRSTFIPDGMTAGQFRRLFRNAFIGFYARPRIIWGFLRQIKSLHQVRILIHRFMDVVSS